MSVIPSEIASRVPGGQTHQMAAEVLVENTVLCYLLQQLSGGTHLMLVMSPWSKEPLKQRNWSRDRQKAEEPALTTSSSHRLLTWTFFTKQMQDTVLIQTASRGNKMLLGILIVDLSQLILLTHSNIESFHLLTILFWLPLPPPSRTRGVGGDFFSQHMEAVNAKSNRYTDTHPSYVTIRGTISDHFLLQFHSSAFQLTWPDQHANHQRSLSTSCMKRIMLLGWCGWLWGAPPFPVTTKFAPVIYQVPPLPLRGWPVPWPACCSCGAAVQYVHFSHAKKKVLICPALLSLMDLLLSFAAVLPPPPSPTKQKESLTLLCRSGVL